MSASKELLIYTAAHLLGTGRSKVEDAEIVKVFDIAERVIAEGEKRFKKQIEAHRLACGPLPEPKGAS